MPTFIKTKFTQEKLEKKLEKIVNKIMNKEKKQSNYPLIIVVEGRSRSGKTSFIKSLFENKDINFTEHSNIGTSENLLYLLDSNIISMHTNITKDEWETNAFKKTFLAKKIERLLYLKEILMNICQNIF